MSQLEFSNIAFISYKREDEEWAKWLQKKLEHYKLPTEIRKQYPNIEFAKNPRHVFKDTTDLSGGVLAKAIKDGLESSKFLIVICSPRAAKSEWVCKEVQDFIDSGREERIIPFIIDGEPYSEKQENECFPAALKTLAGERELLGININENGRDSAVVKVLARLFGLSFETLWQRFEREKKRKRRLWTLLGFFLLIISLVIIGTIADANRKLRYQNVVIEQEREKADSLRKVALNSRDSLQLAFVNIKMQKDSILKQNQIISQQKNDLNKTNKKLQETNVKLAQERDNVLRINWNLMTNQSRSAAGKATELIENGNPLMAKRIAMNYLPDKDFKANWPYVPEVEQAYRKSLATINSAEWHQDTFFEHKLKINSAIFSSNGDKILSASNDNTAMLWDVKTGDILTFKHEKLVNCATMSNDGKYIATGCRDGIARLWDSSTGLLVSAWKPGGNVWEVKFADNDKYVLTHTSNNALSFYDVGRSEIIATFPYHQHLNNFDFNVKDDIFVYNFMDSLITAVSIPSLINNSENIKRIIANKDINEFKSILFRLKPYNITPIVFPHPCYFKDIKYNSANETVCIIRSDSVAVYGDLSKGCIIDTIPNVLDTSFSPDGTTLALSKADGGVLLMSSNKADYEKKMIESDVVYHQLKYSEDGSCLIGTGSDNAVHLWGVSDNYSVKAKLQHKSPIAYSMMNKLGSNVLTTTYDNRINLWGHSVDYKKTSLALADSYADAVIFSNDETCFFVASYDGHISCFDVNTGKQIWTTATFSKKYDNLKNHCIALSANGKMLAVGNECGEIIIVDALEGKVLHRYKMHDNIINSIFFIDNNKVITASYDKKVIISDFINETAVTIFHHNDRVLFADILKNHQQIVSAIADGILLWRMDSKESIFYPLHNDNIESVAYNARTNRIAIGTSNNSIYIKNVNDIDKIGKVFQHGQSQKGELFLFDSYYKVHHNPKFLEKVQNSIEGNHIGASLYDILSHKERVDALQFSVDGNYLISKCKTSIKVWDAATGVCINDDIKVGVGFRCFAMSPKKTYIATSSMNVKNKIPNKKNELVDFLFLWKFNSLRRSLWIEKSKNLNWKLKTVEKSKYYLE